ncbi:MAG: ribosome maturation factor RimM [Methylococcaceae bacterium]|nr:ribosome maturation factor RimM [Methylococcaceae bacterium]
MSGVFGIKGWIKVYSFTEPTDNILRYGSWLLGANDQPERFLVEDGGWHGKTIVAKLRGIDTRDAAAKVVGCGIFVERAELPELPENEFYWADLVGLHVFNEDGVCFGVVDSLMETGANDVLLVRGDRERLIPFVHKQIVKSVDIKNRRLVVVWDSDF